MTDAINNTAIHANGKILQEFNEFIMKFEDRPDHLNHVLEVMEDTRLKKIVPLVEAAAATLKKFTVVEEDYKRVYNRTMKMLNDLEKYKRICRINCDFQLQRSTYTYPKTLYLPVIKLL